MIIKYKEFINENNNSQGIIITIPKSINWDSYLEEMNVCEDESHVMNYKSPNFPKNCKIGNKCYIVYDGFIRGYMIISGFSKDGFTCTTTNKDWSNGCYIQRTGKFHKLNSPIPMKGFQGFRYFK